MGRASRRKRDRAQAPAPDGRPAARIQPRVSWLAAGMVVAVVAALAVAGRLYLRPPSPAAVPAAPEVSLPNPDTSGMTVPVARAIRQARQAALSAPGSGSATGNYCQVLHAHWLYDEAAACYVIARSLAPEDFRWVYLLAGVEDVRGGDGERIDQLFADAIRLSPRFPPAYVRRADALMRLGRWSEARESYAVAAELDPGLILAHRGRGQAAILMGDGPAAVEHLEHAASLAPQDRITQTALARAYTLTGQNDKAAEAARKAQEFTGEAGLPDAVFYQVEVLKADPQTLRTRFARAMREGDHEQALEAAVLLEESGAPGARQQLAAAVKQRANQLAFAGEFDQALAEYQRAAVLAPNDPEIQHNWGTVLLRRGDLEEAGRRFEKAIGLDPRSADSLYNLGVVLEGLGRDDEAITRFREAVAIEPNHLAAQRLAELGVTPDPQP